MYDYLVVGAGIYGSTIARKLTDAGKHVLVIDKRDVIGGNCYTEEVNGIHIHKHGPHIFHTNNREVWNFVNQFANFNRFTNSPIANYHGELFSLPFNMYTFHEMWKITTPDEAKAIIDWQRKTAGITEPHNLEEQAISLVGTDIYKKLIKGYTEKQWGRKCSELPSSIIKRLPIRFTYDNNYYNSNYQGIPIGGYTKMIQNMLEGIEVKLGVDFFEDRNELKVLAQKIVYTGPIDEYFGYRFGRLDFRTLAFETEQLDVDNYQGNAVINYTDSINQWTRIIEHKHFQFGNDDNGNPIQGTIITKEFPKEWRPGDEQYYPVNDERNTSIYQQYKGLVDIENNVFFGGRLGEYKYYDMDIAIEKAFEMVKKL